VIGADQIAVCLEPEDAAVFMKRLESQAAANAIACDGVKRETEKVVVLDKTLEAERENGRPGATVGRGQEHHPGNPDQSILILPEVLMGVPILLLGGAVIVVALLAVYVPTVYIRKTNRLIRLLERIEANTRK
jgi:hypothetical protein